MTSVNGADLASRTRKDYRTPCGPLGADVIVSRRRSPGTGVPHRHGSPVGHLVSRAGTWRASDSAQWRVSATTAQAKGLPLLEDLDRLLGI